MFESIANCEKQLAYRECILNAKIDGDYNNNGSMISKQKYLFHVCHVEASSNPTRG